MALTKLNTYSLPDNAVTSAKIGVNVILAEDIASNAVTVAEIQDDAVTTAKIADSTGASDGVTTAKIATSAVTSAKIADDAITLAKMAAGTDGQIITYDASGNPVAVGPGTDGQVLTSTGAGSPPAFENATGGVSGITSSADGTAMTIDSSERIVMPSQPMVYIHSIENVSGGSLHSADCAYNSNGDTSNIRACSYYHVDINIGSHYSNTTGLFTCPIAGRYYVASTNNYHGYSSWPNWYIVHGTTIKAQSWMPHSVTGSDGYYPLPIFAIINAAANDTIWIGFNTAYNSPTDSGGSYGYHPTLITLLG